MKAKELAKLLRQTPDAEVRAYDPDGGGWYPVTGLTFAVDLEGGNIQLYTDSDGEDKTHDIGEKGG